MAKIYTIHRLSPGYDKDKGFSITEKDVEVATLIRYDKTAEVGETEDGILWEPVNLGPFTPEDFKKVWQPLAEVLTTTSATKASITL